MSTQESQRSSPPHFSSDYKTVAQQVFLVWNFPPTCKPYKYPILINHFLSITLCAQLCYALRLPRLVCQAPLSTGFSRQEYWSGVLFLTPGDLPDPGIELESLVSSALAGGFFTTGPPVKSHIYHFQLCPTLRPYRPQHARLHCPSPTSGACSNSCPSSWMVIPSNHLICRLLLLLPSVFPSIRVFSSESVLWFRWPKYWSFSFSISPSSEYSGLISFRID